MSATTTSYTHPCPTCGEGNVLCPEQGTVCPCDICGTVPGSLTYQGRAYPLSMTRPNSVGRAQDNDVTVHGGWVSRYHCQVIHVAGVWCVTDSDSSNGTYLNGERLPANQGHVLNNGDVVNIGGVDVVFECE